MTSQTGNPQLIDFIRETIRRDGPVTFECFMEQALYHPEHGYYSSGRARIGRRGDYFTNITVGSLFGELLARQFREIWETLGRPEPFTIVEQGAHSGDLAADVLRSSKATPEFAAALRYCIVEPFPKSRAAQRATLEGRASAHPATCGSTSLRNTEQVTWCASLDELEPFCGVHFSNELLDSMPVHVVRLQYTRAERGNLTGLTSQVPDAQWQQKYVGEQDGRFVFIDGALSNSGLTDRLTRVAASLRPPYETEINLRVRDWIAAVSRKLIRGYVVAVDYGYPREEYYAPDRSTGTLRCYAQHRVIESPLLHVGEADLTAHVDWTSVAEEALGAGLQVAGFADQHHFLTGILGTFGENELTHLNRRQLQTLIQPTMLGRTFQFLALSKDSPENLSGFKFARDPQIALGLHTAC